MDTHMIDLPQAAFPAASSPAQPLSADPAAGPVGSEPGDAPLEKARPWRRPVLLATSAVVIVAALGGGFLLSPYNTVYPIDAAWLQSQGRHMAATVSRQATELVAPRPTIVAPAAKIAATEAPEVAAPIRPATAARPTLSEQQAEILSFRPGARPAQPASQTVGETGHAEQAPAPAVRPAPSLVRVAQPAPRAGDGIMGLEPGMAVLPQAQPAPAALQAPSPPAPASPTPTLSTPQPAAPPSAVPPPAAEPAVQVATAQPVLAQAPSPQAAQAEPPRRAEKPADPVAVVALLQAAPMTPPEQIAVLSEVARLAIVVRDIRTENEALKARVESTADRFDQAVADFTRRLALAEAHGALNAAMGANPTPPKVAAPPDQAAVLPASSRSPAGGGTRVVSASAVIPARIQPPVAVRYRVTAASPGLAMLALVDRSGGEGAQIQVAIGDQVPGYGRVTAIQQRGASWVVQTDKGPDKGAIQ